MYRISDPIKFGIGSFEFYDSIDKKVLLIATITPDSISYIEYWRNGLPKFKSSEVRSERRSRGYETARIISYCENGTMTSDYNWKVPIQFVTTHYCDGQIRSRFVSVTDESSKPGVIGMYEFWYPNGQKQVEELYDGKGELVGAGKCWNEAGERVDCK